MEDKNSWKNIILGGSTTEGHGTAARRARVRERGGWMSSHAERHRWLPCRWATQGARTRGAADDGKRKQHSSPDESALEKEAHRWAATLLWGRANKHEWVRCGLKRERRISTREWEFIFFFVWGLLLESYIRTFRLSQIWPKVAKYNL
jgi:hypothetical protein